MYIAVGSILVKNKNTWYYIQDNIYKCLLIRGFGISMTEKLKHISFLDTARGIAIILVVFGHSLAPEIRSTQGYGTIFHWIYSFHMPLFAIISGYLFGKNIDNYKKRGFAVFAKQRFLSLMIPYLTVSIISYIGFAVAFQIPTLSVILSRTGYTSPEFKSAVTQILFCQDNMDKHMWFAYALFIISVLSYLIGHAVTRYHGIFFAFILYVLNYYLQLPEILYRIFCLWIFFTIACQKNLIDRLIEKKYILPVLIVHIAAYLLRLSNILIPYKIPDALIAVITGLSGSIFVLSVSKNYMRGAVNRTIEFLGRESFSIYLMHQPFIVSGASGILLASASLPYMAICILTTIFGIAIPLFLSRIIINRVGILKKLILGKFKD